MQVVGFLLGWLIISCHFVIPEFLHAKVLLIHV